MEPRFLKQGSAPANERDNLVTKSGLWISLIHPAAKLLHHGLTFRYPVGEGLPTIRKFDQFDKHYNVRQEYRHGVWRIECERRAQTPAPRRVDASADNFFVQHADHRRCRYMTKQRYADV
jgi:hypothetical protein